jgi:hypothetical protein
MTILTAGFGIHIRENGYGVSFMLSGVYRGFPSNIQPGKEGWHAGGF